MTTIIQSNLTGGKKVAVAGGGGAAAGATTVAAQNITLFTTPASPADAEYLITIGATMQGTPLVVNSGQSGVEGGVAVAGVGSTNVGFNGMASSFSVIAGAGAAISLALGAGFVGTYAVNYKYCGYRNT